MVVVVVVLVLVLVLVLLVVVVVEEEVVVVVVVGSCGNSRPYKYLSMFVSLLSSLQSLSPLRTDPT